tara:strand:- start:1571 stop:3511 length:1941 start_codon:yes stop_codon:yes gene_type:complete
LYAPFFLVQSFARQVEENSMSIQSLRDNTQGIVAKIIVGAIIVVFALFGMGSITTYLAPVPKVAEVNGEEITRQDFDVALQRNRRNLQAQNISLESIDDGVLQEQVLDSLIERELMAQSVDDLDLYFSDSRIDKEIVDTEVFQIGGVFDANQFQLVIGSAGYSPLGYREELSLDLRIRQLASGVAASDFVTESELRKASRLSQQSRDIAHLLIEVDSLRNTVYVSEDDVRTYYDENPLQFMSEETVELEYLEIRRNDFMDQVTVTEDVLQQFFEETSDQYAKDERRRAAHILVLVDDSRSEEAAKERIDELYQEIVDGSDFSEVAAAHSEDPASASAGGDLGFQARGTYVDAFEESVYALEVNEMSQPVLTEFGYHIIRLLDKEAPEPAVYSELRETIEREYRRAEAERLFVDASSTLSELAFESPDLFEPSEALSLTIQKTGPVGRNETDGIASFASIVSAAFSTDVLLDGNNSNLLEIDPNHHVVLRVEAHSEETLKPYDDVREEVRQILVDDRAGELAVSRAEGLVSRLKNGDSSTSVAAEYNLSWTETAGATRNQLGVDRQIATSAFQLPRPAIDGRSSGQVVLDNGDVAVVTVTGVTESDQDVGIEELQTLGRVLAVRGGNTTMVDYRQYVEGEASVDRQY